MICAPLGACTVMKVFYYSWHDNGGRLYGIYHKPVLTDSEKTMMILVDCIFSLLFTLKLTIIFALQENLV